MNKTIKKYPDAEFESCGKQHPKGCYIILKKSPVTHSEEKVVLIDYNDKDEIVGIDLIYDSQEGEKKDAV